MKKQMEYGIGFIVLIGVLLWGRLGLDNEMLFFRWVMGIGFGYALTRSFFGFAGSVNRVYHGGSTKLMRVLMLLFVGSAIVTAGLLMGSEPGTYNLWVNPINLGLIVGGILFGFGMAFSSCCASGVLTDLVTGLPRAAITLFFFGMGVFVGFPIQSKTPWIQETLFSTATYPKGVYLPDLFKWDGFNGYLGAIILTVLLGGSVVAIAKIIEERNKAKGMYTGIASELVQYQKIEEQPFKLWSMATYERLFVRPWTLEIGATVIGGLFVILMGVTKTGWGASGPFGFWFGKLATVFGVSAESLAEFSGKSAEAFTAPFFANQSNVQNIGIAVGTVIALLLAGSFTQTVKEGLQITVKEGVLFAIGGFAMGFGTRFSNGCNVGALYTPIANFSLSGWIFLGALVVGAIIGNKLYKKVFACSVTHK